MNKTHDMRNCLLLSGLLLWPSCSLIGVEPDEIDFANESETGSATSGQTGSADGGGDGDGDLGDGDGDSDPGDGDGDGGSETTSGDGDGDPTTGGNQDCQNLETQVLALGDNAVPVPDLPSFFEGSCGGLGPELLLQYTAASDGLHTFTFSSNSLDGVLYLVDPSCMAIDNSSCVLEGVPLQLDMVTDDVAYVMLDSDNFAGDATVTVTGP